MKKFIKQKLNEGQDKKSILKYFKDLDYEFENTTISKVEIYYFEKDLVASRTSLNEEFNSKKIESVTDSGIRGILLNHLNKYKSEDGKEHPELAFSPDGLDELNNNIKELNNGKPHAPIKKVRLFESKGNKFSIGYKGNKSSKFVEAAKGTNLFFAIYMDENGKRTYETIPLNIVIERQKQGLSSVPEINENGNKLLFSLSPNEVVKVESDGEKYYKMVSSSLTQCFFVPISFANSIVNKVEISALNKSERTFEGVMIKDLCQKVKINRVGKFNKTNS